MELLEKHFDIAFAAPDGIKRLRELILTLAMQGKLVPQDPSDQPARELLKEIEAEKKWLVKAGKIKEPKPLPEIKPEEVPYELPVGWEWVRLGNIGEINPRNNVDDTVEAGFVPMSLIYSEYGAPHKFERRKWKEIKKAYTHFADSDVVLAKITPCFENGKSCVINELPNGVGAGTTELHVFRNTFNATVPEFVLAYLKNPRYISDGASKMTGSAGQKRVPTDFFAQNPFPLPPLAEQRRIVARIDQLMARCDELEKLRSEREQKRIDVHSAALKSLLTAQEADSFTNAWQFITRHFGELYSVKENVAELRKAILQLAVVGKLVPQDSADQPARELLKEIEAEKKRLVKVGKIKPPKPLPDIKPEEVPYKLPQGWEWVRLGNLATFENGDRSSRYPNDNDLKPSGIPFFGAKDMIDGNLRFDNDLRFISEKKFNALSNGKLVDGDFVILLRGTVGKLAIFHASNEFSTGFINAQMLIIRLLNNEIIGFFRTYCLSNFFQHLIDAKTTGSAVRQMPANVLLDFLAPLPPLAEQHRIVSKVDQLMAMCDELDRQIITAKDRRTSLLNAVMALV